MQRFPLFALVALACFNFSSCERKPATNKAGPTTPPADFVRLEADAAAQSFIDKIESKLPSLQLAPQTSSALVRKNPDPDGNQIVYIFRNLGNATAAGSVTDRLETKWNVTRDRSCWLPWQNVSELQGDPSGPFLGAFRDSDAQITVWIDRFANDLFICYTSPPPPPLIEPEPVEIDPHAGIPPGLETQ